MAPHSLETILPAPQWPQSLAQFVTWCLLWDPKVRPTSRQALEHAYFQDAVDPLRPKTSSSRVIGRKASNLGTTAESSEKEHVLATKTSSWFRKSIGPRDAPLPAEAEPVPAIQQPSPRPSPVHHNTADLSVNVAKTRPAPVKRATWTTGVAPIPILPSVRPISPLPDSATAQANARRTEQPEDRSKKIGRQLSVNSQGNHYADVHRQEAERALNGGSGLKSPTGSSRESFFSHLRKRARRLSGRHQTPMSPTADDMEAEAGCAPWGSNTNRQSVIEPKSIAPQAQDPSANPNFAELDRALQSVRYSLDAAANPGNIIPVKQPVKMHSNPALKRHHSLPHAADPKATQAITASGSMRARRSVKHSTNSRYETPDEEDELLDEAINSAHRAAKRLNNAPAQQQKTPRPPMPQVASEPGYHVPYLTPSPSKDQIGSQYTAQQQQGTPSKPLDIPANRTAKGSLNPQWPTPPYEENDWASAAAASIFATQAAYR